MQRAAEALLNRPECFFFFFSVNDTHTRLRSIRRRNAECGMRMSFLICFKEIVMEWMRLVACSLFLSATRAQCGRQLAMFVSRLGCSRRCWPSTAHRTAQPLPPPTTPPLPVRSNLTSPTFTPQFSKKSKKWKMIENRNNSLANHTITDIEKTGRNKSAIPFGVCVCV